MNDKECWKNYPKYNWVYNRAELLNRQNVKWAPFVTGELDKSVKIFGLEEMPTKVDDLDSPDNVDDSRVYFHTDSNNRLFIETFLLKGETKKVTYYNCEDLSPIKEIDGTLLLKNNALLLSYFSSYTGVITTEFYGNIIISARLRPIVEHKDIMSIKLLSKMNLKK